QVHRDKRVDALRIAAPPGDGGPHRGQVHHARHAGEVLQEDPGRHKPDLLLGDVAGPPARQGLDLLLGPRVPVAVAQQALQEHPKREGQTGDVGHARLFQGVQPVDNRLAPPRFQYTSTTKRIDGCHNVLLSFATLTPPAPHLGHKQKNSLLRGIVPQSAAPWAALTPRRLLRYDRAVSPEVSPVDPSVSPRTQGPYPPCASLWQAPARPAQRPAHRPSA